MKVGNSILNLYLTLNEGYQIFVFGRYGGELQCPFLDRNPNTDENLVNYV